jgi:cysteine desulfurase / selenocysteine lyase
MLYFDNAATSFPKPEETINHVRDFLTVVGGNPGRGGHPLSVDAARLVFVTREKLAVFVNGRYSERMIFTQNGTESLNLAILGLVRENDHVVTTAMEHNAVMRPLDFLVETRRIRVTAVPCSTSGHLDLNKLKKAVKKDTRVVIINHGSNIIGSIQPLEEVRGAIGDKILIVDACQTVGNAPLDIEKARIDALCFSCHKALFGIQGLGAVYLREGIEPVPLRFGGTGSRSEETRQPDMLPDKYESGTPNTPGIAGLLGGLTFIERVGLAEIARKKRSATETILEGLRSVNKVILYGEADHIPELPIILMNIAGMEPSDVAYAYNKAGVCVRVGLHCTPLSHKILGTFPSGAVRISPGYFSNNQDLEKLLDVTKEIASV